MENGPIADSSPRVRIAKNLDRFDVSIRIVIGCFSEKECKNKHLLWESNGKDNSLQCIVLLHSALVSF